MKIKCPKDLCEKVNLDLSMQWFLYDLNLMPEQVNTLEKACVLRGFIYGWESRERLIELEKGK